MDGSIFFEYNNGTRKIKEFFKDKKYIYKSRRGLLDDKEIKRIITFVNSIEKGIKLPVIFDMGEVEVNDKISYILFEYICYYLLIERGYRCCVDIQFNKSIVSYNVEASPLLIIDRKRMLGSQDDYETAKREYEKKFKFDTGPNYIRKIIKKEDHGTDVASRLVSDIETTLKNLNLDEKQRNSICEVIAELIDNSGEHAESDCIIDVDITPDHIKEDAEGRYYGANIVVFDVSKRLFGEKIKVLLKDATVQHSDSYKRLQVAYDYHMQYWDEHYKEEDFFIMSAFQHRISSRREEYFTGGTGLTRFISALELQSDAYQCFLWTGNRKMYFYHQLLHTDNENWVGFNEEKDFMSHIPNKAILEDSCVYFAGTAYNLNFILKKESDYNEQ